MLLLWFCQDFMFLNNNFAYICLLIYILLAWKHNSQKFRNCTCKAVHSIQISGNYEQYWGAGFIYNEYISICDCGKRYIVYCIYVDKFYILCIMLWTLIGLGQLDVFILYESCKLLTPQLPMLTMKKNTFNCLWSALWRHIILLKLFKINYMSKTFLF